MQWPQKFLFVCSLFLAFFSPYWTLRQSGEFNYPQKLRIVCQMIYNKHFWGPQKLKPWYKECIQPEAHYTKIDSWQNLKATFLAEVGRKIKKISTSHLALYTPQENRLAWGPPVEAQRPSWKALDLKNALVSLPSFRKDYFSPVVLDSFFKDLFGFEHLIVDLRDNRGGDFKVLLQWLSFLNCADKMAEFGYLVSSWSDFKINTPVELKASDYDYFFYETLKQNRVSSLSRFNDDRCYKGHVTVLVNANTASVSEMLAAVTLETQWVYSAVHVKRRVWGEPTRGEVLLGVWYALPWLGPDYSLAIPEAIYLTPTLQVLEGVGIQPQKKLSGDWILQSLL